MQNSPSAVIHEAMTDSHVYKEMNQSAKQTNQMWVTHMRESLYLAKYPGFLSLFSIRPGSLKSSRSQTHPYKHPPTVCPIQQTHTHTHTHHFSRGDPPLLTLCSQASFLSCKERKGGGISFWGLAGSSLNSTHCKLKPYSWRWSLHQPKWRAMKASCNEHVGPLSWQWLTNRMEKRNPFSRSLCLLKRKRHICYYLMSLQ